MKELTIAQIELLLGEMKACQRDHPKAKVIYDTEQQRLFITYPLPQDLLPLKRVDFKEI